jgi:hypothetical protein
MSPELFYPKKFGLKDSRPTKHSDCYALGMVIYEVLSGQVPFHRYNIFAVVEKVSGGKRPKQPRGPEGEWFTKGLWRILERCWMPKPDDRPRIEDVLQCLEGVSGFWMPLSPAQDCSDPDTEGSTEESEASSPSQPLETPPPKGDIDDTIPILTLPDAFTVFLYEVSNNQNPGAYAKYPNESNPEESVAVLDVVGWT